MKKRRSLKKICALCIGALVAAGPLPLCGAGDSGEAEIRAVIQAQQQAWNRGDIEAFMNGYWRSEQTLFVSGEEVTRGWSTVNERYKAKYSDREKMGTLTFSDLEIRFLAEDAAVA